MTPKNSEAHVTLNLFSGAKVVFAVSVGTTCCLISGHVITPIVITF